ncbi:hypothetical protein PIB30_030975 [Stylosanthes scabra]|uniref:Fungal-type protein kinase domain-containing protein n=1 Tax=Stylosanthes scabra TaxID=79078 RepID=A0ABU6TDV9_9FABA|nr:hypothetical protein [Stylosanthes scabra]
MGVLFNKPRNNKNFGKIAVDFKKWECFIYLEGLPNNVDSKESVVWCLAWIFHHTGFARGIFDYVDSVEVTRMKVAIALAKTVPNSQRALVDSKAEMLWLAIKP